MPMGARFSPTTSSPPTQANQPSSTVYHEKAQSTFATKMTMITTPEGALPYRSPDERVGADPLLRSANNSFLSDLVTSNDVDLEKPITAGFYRQEAGTELVYTYT